MSVVLSLQAKGTNTTAQFVRVKREFCVVQEARRLQSNSPTMEELASLNVAWGSIRNVFLKHPLKS